MDDPSVNAFALPGGFIYLTRGILGHISSEAELASVLGHEIGHVTAQHSVNQLSKSQLAQGGLLIGAVASPELAQAAELAGLGLQALFMKYSRDDERQADDLGLRYMVSGGWEPREMPKLFALLDDVSASSGGGRAPNWLSSHPDPGARAERARKQISERSYPPGEVRATSYLERLEGLAFGSDPRLGYFEGGIFYHPELRFELRFPGGWKSANETARVSALHPDRVAMVQLRLAKGSSASAAAAVFLGSTGVATHSTNRLQVDHLPAVGAEFSVQRQTGEALRGRALFIESGGRVFELFGLAVQSRWSEVQEAITSCVMSFQSLTDPARLDARPQRIEMVRLPRAMTLGDFAEQFPSQASIQTLGLINRISDPSRPVSAGTLLKRVVGRKFGDE